MQGYEYDQPLPSADSDEQLTPFTITRIGGTRSRLYAFEQCSVWECWSSRRIPIGSARTEEQARQLAKPLGVIHLQDVHDIVAEADVQHVSFRS